MAEKKWFIPADGCTVRDPATREIVPPEGQEVDATTYWVGLVEHENGRFGEAPSKSKSVKKESSNG